jgi:hypothetical protein
VVFLQEISHYRIMPALLTCLRCGCVGAVDTTDSNNLIVNCICQCPTCPTTSDSTAPISGCCYQNIKICKICKSLYKLEWIETQQKCVYLCPNHCQIQFHSKRLTPINSTNVNQALPPWNRTLLHTAVQTCDVELIWELLLKGANPFAEDYRGITPIEIAYAMNQTLSASSKWSECRHSNNQNLERIQQILRIFPDYKPPLAPIFMSPTPAKRNYSEGAHHISKTDPLGTTNSFPFPSDVVRSVTGPGSSVVPVNLDLKLLPASESSPHVAHAKGSGPSNPLEDGTQVYTPLTLIRLTSEADGVAATALLSVEEELDDLGFSLFDDPTVEDLSSVLTDISISEATPTSDPSQSVPTTVASSTETHADADLSENPNPTPPATAPVVGEVSNSLLDWKIRELKLAISLDTDIESKVSFKEGMYSCTACMEDINASSLGYSCPILGCNGTLCLDCFVRSAHSIISSARYAVPVIRCPGGCMHRIPTKLWRGVLSTQTPTPAISEMAAETSSNSSPSPPSVGSILYAKYCNNAQALMKLRCGCCHETCGLFYSEEESGDVIPVTPEDRLNHLNDILSTFAFNQHQQILYLRSWLLFNKGKLSTDTFTTILYDLFEKSLSSEDIKSCCGNGNFAPLEDKYVKPTLLLFCDVERRLCSQLGFYRKFPKIMTTCCGEGHCFMCKVYGHHEEMTCEEMQQNEIGIKAQVLPPLLSLSLPALCSSPFSRIAISIVSIALPVECQR